MPCLLVVLATFSRSALSNASSKLTHTKTTQGQMYIFKARLWESLGKAGPLGRQVSQAVLKDRPKAFVVAAESFFFFLLFFLAFLPIPAIIFTALENEEGGMWEEGNWTFPDSLYYTFITLRCSSILFLDQFDFQVFFFFSTIGFGDMVPDRNVDRIRSPVIRRVYLAGIIVWIILGMGYIWGVVEIISGTLKAGRYVSVLSSQGFYS